MFLVVRTYWNSVGFDSTRTGTNASGSLGFLNFQRLYGTVLREKNGANTVVRAKLSMIGSSSEG